MRLRTGKSDQRLWALLAQVRVVTYDHVTTRYEIRRHVAVYTGVSGGLKILRYCLRFLTTVHTYKKGVAQFYV